MEIDPSTPGTASLTRRARLRDRFGFREKNSLSKLGLDEPWPAERKARTQTVQADVADGADIARHKGA